MACRRRAERCEGATGFLLPSSEAAAPRSISTQGGPSYARPGPVMRPRRAPRRARQPTRFVDRSPAEVVATLLYEGQGIWRRAHDAHRPGQGPPEASRCESGAIAQSEQSASDPDSPSWWPRAPTRPGPGITHHPWWMPGALKRWIVGARVYLNCRQSTSSAAGGVGWMVAAIGRTRPRSPRRCWRGNGCLKQGDRGRQLAHPAERTLRRADDQRPSQLIADRRAHPTL